MNNINFKHSLIFFNFCILISPLFYKFIKNEPILLCLFLILIIGISHGSLDNIKGKKLLEYFGYKSEYIFYLAYLMISFFIILFWLFFPIIVLSLFLIVAGYHFGKEDTVFSIKRKKIAKEILFFLKGSSVIFAPLLFQREATNEIFKILNYDLFEKSFFNDNTLFIFLFLGFISSIYLTHKKSPEHKALIIMDFFSIIILNFFLTPVVAFTLYFCFLHSIRHSITLIFELDKLFKKGFEKFMIKAFPLTLITGLIFLITIFFLNNNIELNEAIYMVIFIGLASLTFPHILLEYLLEKNEK